MLFRIFYNLLLIVLLFIAMPLVFYQLLRHGKYKQSVWQRLGLKFPSFIKKPGDKVIWIHTISLGEAKAAASFFQSIKKMYPFAKIVVSTITETGMAEVKRGMKEADEHFYLPWDFSWSMWYLMKKISPDLIVLTESDLWYHFLFYGKKRGAKTLLINGKLSERSFKRFRKVHFFFRKILSCLDHICVQSALYKDRFITLGALPSALEVTGNIKLDANPIFLSDEKKASLNCELGLSKEDKIVTLGSTHYPEEEMILTVLGSLIAKDPRVKILICPRHIERCQEITSLLDKKKIHYFLYSKRQTEMDKSARVILIDAFGVLTDIYQISDLALVCGSFTDTVGGHNIFEPILYGVPVFFGPHMYSQRDLRDLIKPSGAGRQVSLEDLSSSVESFFAKEEERKLYEEHCIRLKDEVKGALGKTMILTKRLFPL